MKKTLILAFAVTSFTLAGCADETPADVDTTVIEAPAMAEPMMDDTTAMMGDDAMMPADTSAMMDAAPMDAAPMMEDTTTAM